MVNWWQYQREKEIKMIDFIEVLFNSTDEGISKTMQSCPIPGKIINVFGESPWTKLEIATEDKNKKDLLSYLWEQSSVMFAGLIRTSR
jgi:hypothetical protein